MMKMVALALRGNIVMMQGKLFRQSLSFDRVYYSRTCPKRTPKGEVKCPIMAGVLLIEVNFREKNNIGQNRKCPLKTGVLLVQVPIRAGSTVMN